ncbi:MAG: hypothetical protein WBH47_00220 [Streptosporangiaceae bacterium]
MSSYPAPAVLLVSTSAGESWQTEAMPAGAGAYPREAFFGPADGVAWIPDGRQLYQTPDSGRTWTAVAARLR